MKRKFLLTFFVLLAIVFTFASCDLIKGSEESKCTHTTVDENRIEPTCIKDGSYDSVIYCTVCEEEFLRENIIIPATGHNYVNGTCSVCGEAEYVSTGNEYVRCDKDGTPNANGDYILFGEYPQTLKADNVSITTNTDSRGYYLGSDGCYYAKVESNFYKVEPLCWRILSENDEDILLLCENIIANMAYSTNNSNNYKNSNVRAWLNGSFYENAFSQSHQQIIRTTKVDNSALSTGYASNPNSYEDTEDKIFLLSYADVINTNYGFSDSEYDDARKKIATEYARATGSCNSWRLRSHGTGSTNVRQVNSSGSASSGDYLSNVRDTVYGIVPALWIHSQGNDHVHVSGNTVVENNVDATCIENGSYDNVVYCTECGVELSRETVTVGSTGHNYINGTCSACGEAEYVSIGNEYVRCDKDGTPNANGDYILFGEYPQTIKANNVTITSTTDERGYYLGSDGEYYAKVIASPYEVGYTFSTGNTVQAGRTYYFKVEPLRWRILTTEDQKAFILCDSIIESKMYQSNYTVTGNNYYTIANGAPSGTYANNYKYSEVRAWLNGEFYKTTFSNVQQKIVLTTMVDNSAASTKSTYNIYACEDTYDKVFLLSYVDMMNTKYGFSASFTQTPSTARSLLTSDYARAIGAFMTQESNTYGNGIWLLRSPLSSRSDGGTESYWDGSAGATDIYFEAMGVVPALWIKVGEVHTHVYVDGHCSCGESDPDFEENLNASEGLSYSYSNGGYKVTGIGTCKDSNVVIPATYNGYPVVAIADNAFRECESITTLKFAKDSSVTDIGFCAFYECDNLVTVQLPVSLKSFSTCVFNGCQKLTDIYISSDNNYFSTIDGDLYDKNQTKFLQYALAKQNESFIVQEGITTIDRTAFAGAVYLEKLSLPKSVNVLGFEALVGCKRLKEIIVDESNATYKTINGDLYNKNGSTLIQYALGKENVDFVVPIGVITINRAAFEDCEKLTSVHISKTVKVISSLAFRNCSKLEIVTFDKDSQLNTIEYTAFYDCINLESIQIPDGVTALQKYAFYNCKNLVSVVIPDGFTEIGYQAFTGCSNLVIYYKGTSTSWSNITIDSAGASYVKNAVKYFYTPTAPTQSGNYWYYDENDNITIW